MQIKSLFALLPLLAVPTLARPFNKGSIVLRSVAVDDAGAGAAVSTFARASSELERCLTDVV